MKRKRKDAFDELEERNGQEKKRSCVQNCDRKGQTNQKEETRRFFYLANRPFHPSNLASHRVVYHGDSEDSIRELMTKHVLSNFLGMVKHTSTLPRPQTFARLQGPVANPEECASNHFSKGNRFDSRDAADFVELLLYDCHGGRIMEEFKKMMDYLSEAYLERSDPGTRENSKEATMTKTLNELRTDGEIDAKLLADVEEAFEKIKRGKKKTEEVARFKENDSKFCNNLNTNYKERNEDGDLENDPKNGSGRSSEKGSSGCKKREMGGTAKRVWDVLNRMIEDIETDEANWADLYEQRVKALESGIYRTLEKAILTKRRRENDLCQIVSGFGETKRLAEVQASIKLELECLSYLGRCESSYLYLKYFALLLIGLEKDVAKTVEKSCRANKFKNFPLYLNLLASEIENHAFGVSDSKYIIENFVTSASLYYSLGVVRSSLFATFYTHASYVK